MTSMILNSNSSLLESRAVYTADDVDNATQPLSFLLDLWNAAMPTVAESADELLNLADDYESTQPSFAADLRAAAQQGATRH